MSERATTFAFYGALATLVLFLDLLQLERADAADITGDQRRAVRRLHDNFHEASLTLGKFAVVCQLESLNLQPRSPDDPPSTMSDFIVVVDDAQKYRRHSFRMEVINEGELKLRNWFTRVQEQGKIKGGYDYRGPPIEVESVVTLMPDLDPWQLSVASSSAIRRDRAVAGYFSRVCDLSTVFRTEKIGGLRSVWYQYGTLTRLQVVYSDDFGGMPVYSAWLACATSLDPQASEESYVVVSESRSRWFEHGNTWLPYQVLFERVRQKPNSSRKTVVASRKYDFNWVVGDQVDVELLRIMPSVELWDYLDERTVRRPNK